MSNLPEVETQNSASEETVEIQNSASNGNETQNPTPEVCQQAAI